MVARVEITPAAAEIVARVRALHGELMFHQSGGCCDGSAPMCYPVGDFRVGPQDVLLGEVAGLVEWPVVLMGSARHRRGAGPRLRLLGRGA